MQNLIFQCLEHVSFEGSAYLGEWILENSPNLNVTRLYDGQPLPSIDSFDVLIIMGGSMGANDEKKFHWMDQEKKFIAKAIKHKKKIIGICLGSQLLASVLGSRVYPNKEKEIGFFPINKVASNHPVLENFPDQPIVFHWHGDTFDLPKDAILLASSEICKNQAFIWNNQVLGLQFHIEVTESSIGELIKSGKSELIEAPFIQSASKIQEGYQYIPTCHILLESVIEKFLTLKSL